MCVRAQRLGRGRERLPVTRRKARRQSKEPGVMTMMQGGWMGDWGTSYMGGWGGLGMVLIVILVVVGIAALIRK